ncbi:MAG: 3-isopropylmalate dehydratase large subunit, partial [Rectinema sp.]|nr:3-isopropylmalate dehydratase large subunit [Rectinema sp.]
MVSDHFSPNKDIKAAEQAGIMRRFAHDQHIQHYWETGRGGIEHALLPEQGLVTAGDCIIGADSHTCTYGALGAFATGVGSTDLACAMATGRTWFKVPSAIKVEFVGRLSGWVSGKDIVLHLIGTIGVDGARYRSLEFTGDGVAQLAIDERFTIANMGIEAGAKNAIFPVDGQTREYLTIVGARAPQIFDADPDAAYDAVITLDLSQIPLTVAMPHLPSNTREAEHVRGMPIDQVVIGSCTNGHISDLRVAAAILRGKKIADSVRCIIIPGTQRIYQQALREGLLDIFIEAGAVVSPPTCGPCLGGHMGVLARGERAVSTTNRNFVGRMGHVESEVILAGPAVAAASAIAGMVETPDHVVSRPPARETLFRIE